MDRLERMLERSRSLFIQSNDGVYVRVNFTYRDNSVSKEDKKPNGEFEEYLLRNIGQNLFNKYSCNKIDDELKETINELKRIYYVPNNNCINGRARFIS